MCILAMHHTLCVLDTLFRRTQQVGIASPSDFTIRQWLKGVLALCEAAFRALKEVCDSECDDVDGNAVNLAFLTRKEFVDMKERPWQQVMCIHLLSR